MASGSNAPEGQRTSDVPPRPSLDGRETLGKYEIGRQLGAGGMGTVYLAVDSQLKRTIALKVLPKERTENETLVRRFEAEAQAAAQLKHENIVTVYDAGRIDGHLYIALEFVEGTDIYELVARRGPLPLKRSINFVKQMARALEHLHKRGFVHRDIKPSNILVTREGTAKLTDMGLARAVDESLKSNITREGTTVGTVDYMAPEQARDSQAADIRSDIYSLGCTWYQMLTGEPPFPTGSVTNKLYAHISKPRPDPRALNRSVPEEIVAIVHRMMARKPADRYQTPTEVLEDINNLGSGNKRIEELLSSDSDEGDLPTPAYGSPLPLPPRHLPGRSGTPARHGERAPNDRVPSPEGMPARRGHAAADSATGSEASTSHAAPPHAPPHQRMPARQSRAPSDPTPSPTRLPARHGPETTRDHTPRSGMPARRVMPVDEQPVAAGRARMPQRPGETSAVEEPVSSSERRVRAEPVLADQVMAQGELANLDWKPIAAKVAAVAGGLLVLGACIWLGVLWHNSAAGRGGDNAANSPFGPVATALPADSEKEEGAKKEDISKGDSKAKSSDKNRSVLVDVNKVANDKPSDPSTVIGRPDERKNFPAWIAELWNPNAPANAAVGVAPLKTMTVGRVGSEPANAPSLIAAIEQLGGQGGIIELRGPGPFFLPAIKIANRGRLIITGERARNTPPNGVTPNGVTPNGTGAAPNTNPRAENDNAPLIVLVPEPGAKTASGLLAIETSLTLYGVHLLAFADQFPGDNPLRLIDARSSDVLIQKCSFTLVGGRSGATIAFSLSSPGAGAGSDRPTRILLDRTLVRGKELTALEADLPRVDLLAINSLFVTGKAPVLNLSAGVGQSLETAATSGVPRTLRFFSCTTCTDEVAVSLRLGTSGATPPATKFHVMNSVFGSVFQPQGLAMIAMNDWPSRPITAANRAPFENVTWMTESFVARGWQNLVQSERSPPLGTKDAGMWGPYWGEPRSNVDYEPASFPTITEIAAVDPRQFSAEAVGSRPSSMGDSSASGCDVGLLTVNSPAATARALVFSQRPEVPSSLANLADSSIVKEIDLDNPNHKELENLARFINRSDWKSGTRFIVRGTNKKVCGPIHVTNRSLSIEFADPSLVLSFEDTKGESREHNAFITVSGAAIAIVKAKFRVGPTTKRMPRWLLDVKDGDFSIRDSSLEGPSHEKPGFEGLIHFSMGRSPASSKNAQTSCGEIRNSFICTGKTALAGELVSRNLLIENSVLAANARALDLRLPAAQYPLPVVELNASTLAAGEEYLHLEGVSSKRAAGNATARLRVVAEDTVFAPPLASSSKSDAQPVLVGGLPPAAVAAAVDWWEYACAYSNLIALPKEEGPGGGGNDPLAEWKRVAGPTHIVRALGGANAVLLPRDLPPARELVQSDFHLKSVAEAASWSDTGTPIGALLTVQAPTSTVSTPAPKSKLASGKTAPAVKASAKPPSGL